MTGARKGLGTLNGVRNAGKGRSRGQATPAKEQMQ